MTSDEIDSALDTATHAAAAALDDAGIPLPEGNKARTAFLYALNDAITALVADLVTADDA